MRASYGQTRWFYYSRDNHYTARPAPPKELDSATLPGLEQFWTPDRLYYVFGGIYPCDFGGRQAEAIQLVPAAEGGIKGSTIKEELIVDPRTYLPLGSRGNHLYKGRTSTSEGRYVDLQVNPTLSVGDFSYSPPPTAHRYTGPNYDDKLLKPGQAAPNFTVATSSGARVNLSSALAGKKALVLNFWFYGCPACDEEFPRLQTLYQGFVNHDVALLAVDMGDSADRINAYLKQKGCTFPAALSGASHNNTVTAFGVQAYPTNYVIGHDGRVLYASTGFDENKIREVLLAALKE